MLSIKKIQIYGFGKHENVTLSIHDGVTIFYGMNEAGKTTIQQFIIQMLFGFPTRQQTQQKYEPKTSTKFGGQLTISHPIYGECTIERVRGKAAGDVTVYCEDGTKGHDELLAKLLYGYSRASFEAVFAFSIHELQGIEKMSEEELTHLLLASGTTGVQQLSVIEKKLEKDAGELFKKSGKLPQINQKIEQIKQLEKKIKQEQAAINTFEEKSLKLQQLGQRLDELNGQQEVIQKDWQQLTVLKQAMPLMEKQQTLKYTLKNYAQSHFPAEGIRRYEQLKDRLTHETLQVSKLNEQYQVLQKKLQQTVNEQSIDEMARLLHREASWNQLLAKEQKLGDELFLLEQNIEAQFRLLGIQEKSSQQALLEETVSLQQEEEYQQQLVALIDAEEELKFHLRTLEQTHEELEAIAGQKKQYAQDALTADEEHILAKWPQQQKKLEQLRQMRSQRSKQKQPVLLIFVALVMSLLAAVYGVSQKNIAVLVIGVAMTILLILFLKNVKSAEETPNENNARVLRDLEQQENIVHILLSKKQRLEDQQLLTNERQQEKERKYAKLEHKIQQLEQVIGEAVQLLQRFLQRFKVDGTIAKPLLPELFMRIRSAQELATKKTSTVKLLKEVQTRKKELYEQLQQVLGESYSEQEIFMHLRSTYLAAQQDLQTMSQTKEQLATLLQQVQESQPLITNYEDEIEQLFKVANVQEEVAYYEAFAEFEQHQQLIAELQTVKSQLASLDTLHVSVPISKDQLDVKTKTIEEARGELQQQVDACLEQRASLQMQKEQLLNDEKYGELLQQFEQEKAILQQLIEQWAVQKALATAIHKSLFQLREEKLPHVLAQVIMIFKTLTGGRYEKLSITEEGFFEARAITGLRYHVAELSQATKEQAYIALRMALAQTLATTAPFPFIMDDPFVHFDRNRTNKMVQLMKEVGCNRQILYFTCHEAMLEFWQKEQIVDLEALAKERGVTST
ncbi:AAA family ATPase [Lysinibacillus sp. NPDC097287]|uniref:ATP-binding protein n=1 Tax=Lysinibacillus sp. NPDC097287 TaxID=3364144 RepID=UPI00380DB784